MASAYVSSARARSGMAGTQARQETDGCLWPVDEKRQLICPAPRGKLAVRVARTRHLLANDFTRLTSRKGVLLRSAGVAISVHSQYWIGGESSSGRGETVVLEGNVRCLDVRLQAPAGTDGTDPLLIARRARSGAIVHRIGVKRSQRDTLDERHINAGLLARGLEQGVTPGNCLVPARRGENRQCQVAQGSSFCC